MGKSLQTRTGAKADLKTVLQDYDSDLGMLMKKDPQNSKWYITQRERIKKGQNIPQILGDYKSDLKVMSTIEPENKDWHKEQTRRVNSLLKGGKTNGKNKR